MNRYDLTDFEWRVIEPSLPNKPRGVPRADDRRGLNGIFCALRSGALPAMRSETGTRRVYIFDPHLTLAKDIAMNLLFWAAALLLGAILTSQVATNKQLGEHLHNLYIPAAANMIIGIVATLALTLALSREWPTTDMVKSAPWYLWLAGGLFGAIYLTGTVLLAPRIGAATLIGLVVTGQIIFSVMIDNYGWFGFEQHTANLPRIAGCLLLIGGVALVSKF